MAPSHSTRVTTQPFRTLYKFFRFIDLGFRVPFWLLRFSLFRSSRPNPKWTLRQTLSCRVLREMLDIASKTETPLELSLEPGKEKGSFKVIEPAEDIFYKGPLSGNVLPATTGGTWFPKPVEKMSSDLAPDAHVVYHIHGGGFVIGDGRTGNAGFLASTLLRHGGEGAVAAVFSLQYRLSCPPASAPFPAALQDVLTGYLHLLRAVGVPAAQITVSGDSAGGNLAVGLLRYLADFGADLGIPTPGSVVLVSPWVSPAASAESDDDTAVATVAGNPHYATDYLPPSFPRWGARAYAGAATPVSDPYITALGHPFRLPGGVPVPVLVTLSPTEMLAVDVAPWVEEMRAVEGNEGAVEVNYEEGAPHDTLLLGNLLGWADSAAAVAAKIGAFIREATLKAEARDSPT